MYQMQAAILFNPHIHICSITSSTIVFSPSVKTHFTDSWLLMCTGNAHDLCLEPPLLPTDVQFPLPVSFVMIYYTGSQPFKGPVPHSKFRNLLYTLKIFEKVL